MNRLGGRQRQLVGLHWSTRWDVVVEARTDGEDDDLTDTNEYGDLAEDLRRFLDNLPMKHGPEPSVRERMGKFARRHPGLCGSTSIALFSLVYLRATRSWSAE